MILTAPVSGRLLVRQLAVGAAIVGVLRFGIDFVPVETALYGACLVDGELRIGTQAIEGPIGGWDRYGSACNWLSQPVWRRSTDPRQFTVRFVEAFPDANQWTVVAISSGDLALPVDAAGHIWMDVREGSATIIEPPMEARGEALGGVLASPVWPARTRELYSTPKLPSWQRPYFVQHHQILARVGNGELTVREAKEVICADDTLHNLFAGSIDKEFCRFLAAHPQSATLEGFGPRSASQVEEDEARAAVIVRGLVANQRIEELRELAAELSKAA